MINIIDQEIASTAQHISDKSATILKFSSQPGKMYKLLSYYMPFEHTKVNFALSSQATESLYLKFTKTPTFRVAGTI